MQRSSSIYIVTGSLTTVRAVPFRLGSILRVLHAGEYVEVEEVLERPRNWARVVGGGYIRMKHLALAHEAAP